MSRKYSDAVFLADWYADEDCLYCGGVGLYHEQVSDFDFVPVPCECVLEKTDGGNVFFYYSLYSDDSWLDEFFEGEAEDDIPF